MSGFADRGGWWVVAQVVLVGAAVAAILWTEPALGAVGRVAGAVLVIAGIALGVAAWAALGRHLSPFPAPVAGGELVERGPYRFARHPMYGAVILLVVGSALLSGSLVAIGLAFVFVPFFWLKSSSEEGHLLDRYGGYEAYRRRVPRRLLPWLL